MKLLPIGIQSFENIRSDADNTIYIDKTQYIYQMITQTVTPRLFLSRPRRFGKSLLVDTMRLLFQGRKELFTGLRIHDKRDWSRTYPVIMIDFGSGKNITYEALRIKLYDIVVSHMQIYDIQIPVYEENMQLTFHTLIQKIYQKTGSRVVILIDEYDKAIIDNIQTPLAVTIREEIKSFFSAIKSADQYLQFVFITGISRFSKVSLFSGLNNLYDISMKPQYNALCGYTYQEIVDNFGPEGYLDGVDMDKMKHRYNGYNFAGTIDQKVYNPFGLLQFFANDHMYQNYRFQTSTPTFLIKLIQEQYFPAIDLENVIVGSEILDSFDVEHIDITTLLFQTGYLTIKEADYTYRPLYTLCIPNEEVRYSLNEHILKHVIQLPDSVYGPRIGMQIERMLASCDVDGMMQIMQTIYAGIPYANYTHNDISQYEGYYASIFYSVLAAIGIQFIAEDFTSRGRIDMTIKHRQYVYIMEFKTEKTGLEAIEQIQSRGYADKYRTGGSEKIVLVGVQFDVQKREIAHWEHMSLSL